MKHNEHKILTKLGTHHERARRQASHRERDIEEQEWQHLRADAKSGRLEIEFEEADEYDLSFATIRSDTDTGELDRDYGSGTRIHEQLDACLEHARWATLT